MEIEGAADGGQCRDALFRGSPAPAAEPRRRRGLSLSIATGHTDAVTTARPRYLVLKGLVAILIGIKIWSLLKVNLVSDEAYYWMWGQHPELSYFDHPPLNAWM